MNNLFFAFHYDRNICFILIIIIFLIGCKKNTTGFIQENIKSPVCIETVSITTDTILLENTDGRLSGIVNNNAIRIRDKPSLEGNIIGQLNSGMKINVLGRSEHRMLLKENNSYWLKINLDNIDGWTYGAYIDLYEIQHDTLSILSSDKYNLYFTTEFLERVIVETNLSYIGIIGDVIFDRTKIDGLRVYQGGRILYDADGIFWFDSDTLLRYLEYENYNIILVTQEIDSIEYVCDYLIIEKKTTETYLFKAMGTVKIDGEFPSFDVTVVINNNWIGLYTNDISQAFKINPQTRKIEPIFFKTIRLTSEL